MKVVAGTTRKKIKKSLPFYLMMLPGLLYFLIYRYVPMYGVIMAFQDFRLARGFLGSDWVGLDNFKEFFGSPFFSTVMENTLIISLSKLVFGFAAPIILALMINSVRNVAYKRVIQTVVYLPRFISWIIMANLVSIFLSTGTGVIPELIHNLFGVDVAWLTSTTPFRIILVVTDIWKEAGWGTIIYMAALTGIDPSLYEAASIDGARKGQMMRYITIPSIIPIVTTMLILRVGSVLNTGFEQIFALQNDAVALATETLEIYSYKRGFVQGDYGFGTAVSLFQSLVGMVMVIISNHLAEKYGEGGVV